MLWYFITVTALSVLLLRKVEGLSLDLSKGSVILPWAISPVQPGKSRGWLQARKAMNGKPRGSFSLPVMIASFYNRSLSRSSEEMNLG